MPQIKFKAPANVAGGAIFRQFVSRGKSTNTHTYVYI